MKREGDEREEKVSTFWWSSAWVSLHCKRAALRAVTSAAFLLDVVGARGARGALGRFASTARSNVGALERPPTSMAPYEATRLLGVYIEAPWCMSDVPASFCRARLHSKMPREQANQPSFRLLEISSVALLMTWRVAIIKCVAPDCVQQPPRRSSSRQSTDERLRCLAAQAAASALSKAGKPESPIGVPRVSGWYCIHREGKRKDLRLFSVSTFRLGHQQPS